MDGVQIFSEYVFSSIIPEKIRENENEIRLLQHFKGWFIETPTAVFDPLAATLMDFRVPQTNGTTFVYVMPFSPTSALVEYTLFSHALLDPKAYDTALEAYVRETLNLRGYSIVEEEFGVIPMTSREFPEKLNNIIYLGTAGGQTKPSSGYTFNFIQRHSDRLIKSLEKTGKPGRVSSLPHKRFRLYDHTLLHILANEKMEGVKIFSGLFSNNKMTEVLQFLDNETSLTQELRLVSALPTRLFLRAAIRQF
jgi:lycopene beta-cyclase